MSSRISPRYPSPKELGKSASDLSQQSNSSLQSEIDAFVAPERLNTDRRIRASSWDDSDDDSKPVFQESKNSTRIYTNENQKPNESIKEEITQLKRQFFDSLQKIEDQDSNYSKDKIEIDRRQSPARIRRRTKSSSSSSPVLDTKCPDSPDFLKSVENNSQQQSPILDSSFYLNNFFTELRSKRISLDDSSSERKNKHLEVSYNQKSLTPRESEEHYCKTSRKLSKILEVEENKKETEKNSQENTKALFCKSHRERDNSPLPTSRSKKNEKNPKKDTFKSNSEECRYYLKIVQPCQKSLTDRSDKKFDDFEPDFISLSAKAGKTKLTPQNDPKNSLQYVCLTSPVSVKKDFLQEPMPGIDCNLKLENPTPRSNSSQSKSSSRSNKISERSNISTESPTFLINIGRDSERSLKIEDINTPDSSKKKAKTSSRASSISASENLVEKHDSSRQTHNIVDTERSIAILKENPSLESIKSTLRSSQEPIATLRSKTSRSSQSSFRKINKLTNQSLKNYSNEEEVAVSFRSKTSKNSSFGEIQTNRSLKDEFNQREVIFTSSREQNSIRSNQSTRSSKSPRKTPTDENIPVQLTAHSKSNKSSGSDTLRTLEDELSNPKTSRSKDSKLSINLVENSETQKYSNRSRRSASEIQKSSDRHITERSLSSKSSMNDSKKSTPRIYELSSMTSYNNVDENAILKMAAWKELERACDTISDRISVSSRRSHRDAYNSHKISASEEEKNNFSLSHRTDLLESERSEIINSRRSLLSSKSPRSIRSRPNSTTSTHNEILTDELQLDVFKEKLTSSSSSEEELNVVENQRFKEEFEKDKISNRRLSVINEISFEDLDTNDSTDNEENNEVLKSDKINSKKSSQRKNRCKIHDLGNDKWDALIEDFQGSPKSFVGSDRSSFYSRRSLKKSERVSQREKQHEKYEEKEVDIMSYTQIESVVEEKEAKIPGSGYNEMMIEKILGEKNTSRVGLQGTRNVFVLNTGPEGSFGIGEFGDIKSWKGNSDIADSELPKDHGDGIYTQNNPELLVIPEKKDKETKPQRLLWTESKNMSDSKSHLNKFFLEDVLNNIPMAARASKSDNCIIRNIKDQQDSTTSIPRAIDEDENSELVESDLELEGDRTPRLSKSLSNLDLQRVSTRESKETCLTGRTIFDTVRSKEDTIDLNVFQAKGNKTNVKQNNWLSISKQKRKKNRRNRRSAGSSKSTLLSSRNQKSVPRLKLRNSSCFQNFYKRFVSVFCITSHSSAATSK